MCCKAYTLREELHKRYLKNVAFGMKDNPIIDSDDVYVSFDDMDGLAKSAVLSVELGEIKDDSLRLEWVNCKYIILYLRSIENTEIPVGASLFNFANTLRDISTYNINCTDSCKLTRTDGDERFIFEINMRPGRLGLFRVDGVQYKIKYSNKLIEVDHERHWVLLKDGEYILLDRFALNGESVLKHENSWIGASLFSEKAEDRVKFSKMLESMYPDADFMNWDFHIRVNEAWEVEVEPIIE